MDKCSVCIEYSLCVCVLVCTICVLICVEHDELNAGWDLANFGLGLACALLWLLVLGLCLLSLWSFLVFEKLDLMFLLLLACV